MKKALQVFSFCVFLLLPLPFAAETEAFTAEAVGVELTKWEEAYKEAYRQAYKIEWELKNAVPNAEIEQARANASAKAVNDFALEYFAQLRKESRGNIVFSPYGIYRTLLRLVEADDESFNTIRDILGTNSDSFSNMRELDKLIESHKLVLPELTKELVLYRTFNLPPRGIDDVRRADKGLTEAKKDHSGYWEWRGRYDRTTDFALDMTAVWSASQDAAEKYRSVFEGSDFFTAEGKKPLALLQKMGDWVSANTEHNVVGAFKKKHPLHGGEEVITDVSYFKSTWELLNGPGGHYLTLDRSYPFITHTGQSVEAMYLGHSEKHHYVQTSNYHAILLPYSPGRRYENNFSFVLLKPLPDRSMDITVDAIAPKEVFRIAAALVEKMKTTTEPLGRSHQPVIYSFPVFGFSQTHPVFEVLEKIKKHKTRGEDDNERTLQPDFYHTSFFSCNEDGSVIEEPPILREVRKRTDWEKFYRLLENGFSNSKPKPNNPEFYANSPFIFLVIENKTGLVFQMGVVKDPSIDAVE